MRIIETFICFLESKNEYVKVHRGRDNNGDNIYFKELPNGSLEKLSDKESNVLLTNDK